MVLRALGLQAQRGVEQARTHLHMLMQDADSATGNLQRGAQQGGAKSQRLYRQFVKEGLFALATARSSDVNDSQSDLLESLCRRKADWCDLIARAKDQAQSRMSSASSTAPPAESSSISAPSHQFFFDYPFDSQGSQPAELDTTASSTAAPAGTTRPPPFEVQTVGDGINSLELSYCQHVDLNFPLQAADVDELLAEATNFTREASFEDDVSCCLEWQSGGDGGLFGQVGDGLDIISDEADSIQVFRQDCGRVKVVDAINFCGGAATNVIGCAPINSNTMVVVRLSSPLENAKLWVHEAGHNVGLDHNPSDVAYLMFESLAGEDNANVGLTASECAAFLSPPRFAGFDPQQTAAVCLPRRSDVIIENPDREGDSASGFSGGQIAGLAIGMAGAVLVVALIVHAVNSQRASTPHGHDQLQGFSHA